MDEVGVVSPIVLDDVGMVDCGDEDTLVVLEAELAPVDSGVEKVRFSIGTGSGEGEKISLSSSTFGSCSVSTLARGGTISV